MRPSGSTHDRLRLTEAGPLIERCCRLRVSIRDFVFRVFWGEKKVYVNRARDGGVTTGRVIRGIRGRAPTLTPRRRARSPLAEVLHMHRIPACHRITLDRKGSDSDIRSPHHTHHRRDLFSGASHPFLFYREPGTGRLPLPHPMSHTTYVDDGLLPTSEGSNRCMLAYAGTAADKPILSRPYKSGVPNCPA